MTSPAYRICTRCVMDTSDPDITFDAEGRCNHCTDYLGVRVSLLNRDPADTAGLSKLMATIKQAGRGSKYDCVVGMSGGVDSSYVATLAVEHGLRVLAVHLDNGWNSPIAVENINKLVTKLGLGYASYVLPWNDFKKVQVAFLKASIPEAETPTDVAIQRAVHAQAAKHGVRYILSGGNLASEGILPATWHYNARDMRYARAVMKAAGCPWKHFSALSFSLPREVYYRVGARIKTVYPLNHVVYDKGAARASLEQNAGWRYYGSKHGESRFTKYIQTYYLVVKHGIDYRRATLSSEICIGQIERDEALKVLGEKSYNEADIATDGQYIAKKLGISDAELRDIVAAAPRWYRDFPNNEVALGRIYSAYRYLTGRARTSNF